MNIRRSRSHARARRSALFTSAALLALAAALFSASGLFPSSARQPAQTDAAPKKEASAGSYHLETSGRLDSRWPRVSWKFSIKRTDNVDFDMLDESNIVASVGGRRAEVVPGSLKPVGNQPRGVFLMIDRSLSMTNMNKLETARESLKTFLGELREKDLAVIGSFAHNPTPVGNGGYNKDELIAACDLIDVDPDAPNGTHIYDALKFALTQPTAGEITDVVFLSDGIDSTGPTPEQKKTNEQDIINLARAKHVRVHTIAVGVAGGDAKTDGVDYQTLNAISLGTHGEPCLSVDTKVLRAEADATGKSFEELLRRELDSTLSKIKKRMSYAYEVELKMPDVERKEGVLNIAVNVPDGPRVHELKVDYGYDWREGSAAPAFGEAVIYPVRSIIPSDPKVPAFDRARLYAWMVLAFFALALIPPAATTLTSHGRARKARKSIVAVGCASPILAQQCPSEGDEHGGLFRFREGDSVIVCPVCETPHHLSCWKWNGFHCMRQGCRNRMEIPPNILLKYGLV